MKKEKSCGFILLNLQQQVLLLKHRSGNHWDFCKGHPTKNEDEMTCAKREVYEELGCQVDVIKGFKCYSHYTIQNRSHKTVCWFLGKVQGDIVIQEEEIETVKWVDLMQAHDCITYSSSRAVLTEVIQFLEKRIK